MKALIVYYTNSKDIMKKKVCFNTQDVNKVYTYGCVQKITNQDGLNLGLMIDTDLYFKGA